MAVSEDLLRPVSDLDVSTGKGLAEVWEAFNGAFKRTLGTAVLAEEVFVTGCDDNLDEVLALDLAGVLEGAFEAALAAGLALVFMDVLATGLTSGLTVLGATFGAKVFFTAALTTVLATVLAAFFAAGLAAGFAADLGFTAGLETAFNTAFWPDLAEVVFLSVLDFVLVFMLVPRSPAS